jgi:SAM-dependent methyltransferase
MAGTVAEPAFWQELYEQGRDGWDLRGPTPVLARLLGAREVPPAGRAAVPGCGRGHDARLLARHGHATWGFDFAPAALAEARRLAATAFDVVDDGADGSGAGPAAAPTQDAARHAGTAHALPGPSRSAPLAFEARDVFTLDEAYAEFFDLVWEYTCFPAIDPARRPEYVRVVRRILRPGGLLLALFFPVDPEWLGGPPFGATRDEIERLLADGFHVETAIEPADSVPARRGKEWLVRARRL